MRKITLAIAVGAILSAGTAHAAIDAAGMCKQAQAQAPGSTVSISLASPKLRISCPGMKGQPKVSIKAEDADQLRQILAGKGE